MRWIVIIFLITSSNLLAQQQITWQKYFGGVVLGNEGAGIIQMEDSGFVVAAFTLNTLPKGMQIIRLNKNGDTIWTKQYEAGGPQKIIKTADGGFAVAASCVNGINLYPRILILDSVGDSLWSKCYLNGNTKALDICETHDNGFVIATQGSFFKVDKSGNFMWDVYMGNCKAVKQGFNGDIIASGSTCNNPDIYTVDRVDSMGNVIWNRTYGNITNTSDWYAASDFVLLPDSNIMAVCDYQPGGWHLMKINYATGDTMFTRNFLPWGSNNYGNPIAYMADGNLVTALDYIFFKFDTVGNEIWHAATHFNLYEIVGCSDNGVAATGSFYPSPPQSVVTYAKTDSLGNIYNFQGINNLYGKGDAWVYPNPIVTTGTLQFKNPQQQKVTLTVYDMLGNAVSTQQTTGSSFIINAATLKSRMYFYRITSNTTQLTGKFLVE